VTRRLTILLAALEAALTVAIGIALPLVPLTVLWAVHFGFGVDWTVFWRGALDVWLLGHGVDVVFRLDEATAEAVGIGGAREPVRFTLALLGIGLVTLLLSVRGGRRIAEAGHRLLGGLAATAAVALLSFGLTAVSLHDDARPSLVQAATLPPLVVVAGLGIGMAVQARSRRASRPAADDASMARGGGDRRRAGRLLAQRLGELLEGVPEPVRHAAGAALRGGLGTAAILLAASSLLLALLLLLRYAEIVRLYEALHGEVLGGIVVTAAELALLPDLVVWTASWLLGPGFALGAGSQVSLLGTAIGPVPALPVLGAIPPGDAPFAFLGLAVPIAAALLAGAMARRRLDVDGTALPLPALIGAALGQGAVAGLALGLLAAMAAGSAGPGRLAEVGPDALAVGIAAAAMSAVAGGVGLLVGGGAALDRIARLRPGSAADAER